jgi:phosphonopyruvate decarboxylase
MLDPGHFVHQLQERGFAFFSGVPCSYLKGFINAAQDLGEYIIAANEGDAVAVCAGAFLGGKKPVVLMQNSGLTNAMSPLTSLCAVFRIPVLVFVSLRGEEGVPDEPQHALTGKITIPLLDLMGIPWEYLSGDPREAAGQLDRAARTIDQGEIFAFVVRKDTFALYPAPRNEEMRVPSGRTDSPYGEDTLPLRSDALAVIRSAQDSRTFLIATTGYTSREVSVTGTGKNEFSMIGSMGCAASIGLGLALARPDRSFIIVDGDGALLMRLGSLATTGWYRPKNLLHILLDNSSYESTGGQPTVAGVVDFAGTAASCGYPKTVQAHNLEDLRRYVSAWRQDPRLTFIHLKIQQGTLENLGRPATPPPQMRERFMDDLRGPYP